MNNNYSTEQQLIISTLTNLLYELNMDLDVFYRNLRKHYIHKVYNFCHNATRMALRCGIDRRIVAAIPKNKKLYYKRAILPIIIDAIRVRTGSGNKLLLKRGNNSLETIIKKTANGATTVNTVLDVLTSKHHRKPRHKTQVPGLPAILPTHTTKHTSVRHQF